MNHRTMSEALASTKRRISALESSQIDTLLAKYELVPSIRQWLRGQTLPVVQDFLRATKPPKATDASPYETTRESTETGGSRRGLQGAELETVNRLMGVQTRARTGPYKDECGRLVVPIMRPSEVRQGGAR